MTDSRDLSSPWYFCLDESFQQVVHLAPAGENDIIETSAFLSTESAAGYQVKSMMNADARQGTQATRELHIAC